MWPQLHTFFGVLSALTSPTRGRGNKHGCHGSKAVPGDMRFGSPPWQTAAPCLHTLLEPIIGLQGQNMEGESRCTPRNLAVWLRERRSNLVHRTAITFRASHFGSSRYQSKKASRLFPFALSAILEHAEATMLRF